MGAALSGKPAILREAGHGGKRRIRGDLVEKGVGRPASASNYISVRFATRFSGGRTVAELVTFRLEDNGTWRVAGYAIQYASGSGWHHGAGLSGPVSFQIRLEQVGA